MPKQELLQDSTAHWHQLPIVYSKITKVSDMQGSFENDAVILFAYLFFHYSSHATNDEKT